MINLRRAVLVTLGLIGAGIVVGGLCGGVALAIVMAIYGNWRGVVDPRMWMFAGMIGGGIGGIAAPIMSWLFLRHVSLGRIYLETAIGTVAGGVVSFLASANPIIGAVVGFTLAGMRLAFVTRHQRRIPSATGVGPV